MWCLRCPRAHLSSSSGPSTVRTITTTSPHSARPPTTQSAPVKLYSKHRSMAQAQADEFRPRRVSNIDETEHSPKDLFAAHTPSSAPRRRAASPATPPASSPQTASSSNSPRQAPIAAKATFFKPKQTSAPPAKVGWANVALTDILPALHRGKITTARSAHFHIRAAPATALPRPRPPPFPVEHLRKRPEAAKVINFAFLATKAKVSKLATKRNQARRRLKAAVHLVVNGRGGEPGAVVRGSPDLVVDGEWSRNGLA